jgi:hypothetical protein
MSNPPGTPPTGSRLHDRLEGLRSGLMGLLQRQRSDAQHDLQEVKRVLQGLKASNTRTRCAVGAGVSLANAEFLARFGTIESFRRASTAEREQFYARLGELELSVRSENPEMALGLGLYRIWVTEAIADSCESSELLGEALAELSRGSWAADAGR